MTILKDDSESQRVSPYVTPVSENTAHLGWSMNLGRVVVGTTIASGTALFALFVIGLPIIAASVVGAAVGGATVGFLATQHAPLRH